MQKFSEGKKAFDQGQFEVALIAFQASMELQTSPNTRLYIGRCYRGLGKVASAFTFLQLAAREAEDRIRVTGEQRYEATRTAAAKEASLLKAKVPYLTLRVTDPPDDIRVQLDGEPVERSLWNTPMAVDPGTHEVAAKAARARPYSHTVALAVGQKRELTVEIERLPTSVLKISLLSRPDGLAVELDGKAISPSRFERAMTLDAGVHEVKAVAPGYKPYLWTGTLTDGEQRVLEIDLAIRRQGGTPRWLFWTMLGTSAVSLAVGGGLALDAELSAREEDAKPNPLDRSPAVKDRIETERTIAAIAFVAGGATAIATVVLGFTTNWKRPSKERRLSVSPWLGRHATGLAVGAAF